MQNRGKVQERNELFVGGLSSVLTEIDVINYVRDASGVTPLAVKLIYDPMTLNLKPFFFLSLETHDDAQKVRSALGKLGLKIGDAHASSGGSGCHSHSKGMTDVSIILQNFPSPGDKTIHSAKVTDLGFHFTQFLVSSFQILIAKLNICLSYYQKHSNALKDSTSHSERPVHQKKIKGFFI